MASLGVIDFPPAPSGALPTYGDISRSPGALVQDIWAYQPHTHGVLYGSDEAIDEDVRWLSAQGDPERLGYQNSKAPWIVGQDNPLVFNERKRRIGPVLRLRDCHSRRTKARTSVDRYRHNASCYRSH